MPQRIVDQLEIIQVEHQQGNRQSGGDGELDLGRQARS